MRLTLAFRLQDMADKVKWLSEGVLMMSFHLRLLALKLCRNQRDIDIMLGFEPRTAAPEKPTTPT